MHKNNQTYQKHCYLVQVRFNREIKTFKTNNPYRIMIGYSQCRVHPSFWIQDYFDVPRVRIVVIVVVVRIYHDAPVEVYHYKLNKQIYYNRETKEFP